LQSTFGINILKAGGYVLIIWGVGTLTDLIVGGWLVDYLIQRGYDANRVRKTVLIAGLVLGFAVIGAAYTKDINVAVFWITVSVAGISFHAPVGWSIPALISPANSTGQVGGIMNFLNNVAGFFAPTITGIIVARTGSFNIALITAAVILIVGIFSYVVVLGRIDKVPEPAVAR
jgi:nitrate/nitrite transporter NarK